MCQYSIDGQLIKQLIKQSSDRLQNIRIYYVQLQKRILELHYAPTVCFHSHILSLTHAPHFSTHCFSKATQTPVGNIGEHSSTYSLTKDH